MKTKIEKLKKDPNLIVAACGLVGAILGGLVANTVIKNSQMEVPNGQTQD